MKDLQPGMKCYTVEFDHDRLPEIMEQWYVNRSGSRVRWRNIYTGREWNENGMRGIFRNKVDAFLALVGFLGSELMKPDTELSVTRREMIAKRLGDMYPLSQTFRPSEWKDN